VSLVEVKPLIRETVRVLSTGRVNVEKATELRRKLLEHLDDDDLTTRSREHLIVASNSLKNVLDSIKHGDGWTHELAGQTVLWKNSLDTDRN